VKTPREIKKMYEEGENIMEYCRSEEADEETRQNAIEMAYELQAGSYVDIMQNEDSAAFNKKNAGELATKILSFCQPQSILEAGVGEATTLSEVLNAIKVEKAYGLDLSWSRLAHAKKWLEAKGQSNTKLCSGDFFNMPFLDDSIDVVFTSHAVEPNGGKEAEILKELYRVCRKYLILLEPTYEFASEEAKQRMDDLGYCKNLKGVASDLGFEVLEHQLFPHAINALNPSALTVIHKGLEASGPTDVFACPKFKTPLKFIDNMYFSPEALRVYPVIGGIPCLRIENGIFASKFEDLI
jgi:ubiquinone/menaquinone biosynthesis C-methylase UbiE